MQFPPFHSAYLGDGMVIGLNGIIHVWISHGVAIGAFLALVLADWTDFATRGRHAEAWNVFHGRLLKFTVITVTIIGAVTGAGIWFTIGALTPRATASMLRVFFWPWFIEWIIFVVEVITLLLLYIYWKRLANYRRLRLGFSFTYLGVAFVSAVLITGILGFMLTPHGWPLERQFYEAFFNPSFVPQLIARLALSVLIGGLLGMAFAVFPAQPREFQAQAVRLFGVVLGVSTAVLLVGAAWQYAVIPRAHTSWTVYSVITAHLTDSPGIFYLVNGAGFALFGLVAWLGLRRRVEWTRRLVVPALVVSVGLAAELERIREFIRGPYLMPGYMYVNAILLQERPFFHREGMLRHNYWYQARYSHGNAYRAGAHLFSQNCGACHTYDGVNDIRTPLVGRSQDGVYVLVGRSHTMAPFMPPFAGSEEERRATARFLYQLTRGEVRMALPGRAVPDDGEPSK